MAAINPVSRVVMKRREKITALPLYYSGYLLKKYIGQKDFKRFFGELRGSTIFLYTDDTNDTYSERVELQSLVAMVADTSRTKTGLTIFTLTLRHEEIQLKIDDPDAAEVWRGFIMTVAKLEIPSRLQLLPGQMLRLEEVLEQERQRDTPPLQPVTSDPGCPKYCPCPPSPSFSTGTYDDTAVPPCFFPVSRQEAMRMLAHNPNKGNIILRPANDNVNYAITMRQVFNSGPVMKHYKVRSENSGFVIELDEPVTVPSLKDAVDHFLKIASCCLRPYTQSEAYNTRIEVPSDPPVSPPGPPLARVAPMIRTGPAPSGTQSWPLPKKPLAEENEYVDLDLLQEEAQTAQRRGKHRQAAVWESKGLTQTTDF
ncbi:hypothetical protein SKAU_G00034280 [Synaphobranchus kaupii]|uniref:Signal-transducing adaptor protein 1 n=1 Tax=Synaphobranchus kaupii TaxID=118154 RepID=A0A9Q1JFN3_SYNKA|nr:hypothetical protein SKAU_G00034280 [Synaphobranchus kaupii]